MNSKRLIRRILWVVVPSALMFSAGYSFVPADEYFEISKNLDIFGKMYREIHGNYVDAIEPGKFMRTGMDAMLESLDPYTNYISASEIEDYRFMNTGQYGGIGAGVARRGGKVIITEPYEGYPAVAAGLRAGDEIIQIDDVIIAEQDLAKLDVRDLLRGAPNTSVMIKVRREGEQEPMAFTVARADVKIKNVPYSGMINPETGYIILSGFTQGAGAEVRMAYEGLKASNPGMKKLILDLRGNPGGLLLEAVEISNLFVPQREKIVDTRGRMEGQTNAFYAEHPPMDLEIPIAVLVNRSSASASEIVSGVIQDLDRGVLVGQRSYGKGLVQTTKPLSYNTQIKITTAKYYIPSGRCIQALDYSHRNEDGSVGKVADSLMKPFKTRNGRTVYDGGGVLPDVVVPLPVLHAVVNELFAQGIIFDFATHYRNKHDLLPGSLRDFTIDDALYREFTDYVKTRDFKYNTKTEAELEKLRKLMEEEAYLDGLRTELAAVEKRIADEKAKDLITFRKEISTLLRYEIISRYHYKRGTIEAAFDSDPDVLEAIKVLNDDTRYKTILGK